MQNLGIPVRSDPGLLMLTTAGVGLVAVLVDLLAVGLRRPAAAGLPMLAVYAVPVAIDLKSVSFIPFAIGAAGFLWLLVTDNVDRVRLFGRRFTGDGKGVDMWEPSPLAAVGRRIAVGCVALAILLPVATPGFGKGLVGVLGTVGGDGSGSGNCSSCKGANTVDLLANLAGQLTNNDSDPAGDGQDRRPDPGLPAIRRRERADQQRLPHRHADRSAGEQGPAEHDPRQPEHRVQPASRRP